MWRGILDPQPVYQSDIVKTGSNSGVKIETNEGSLIDISENSLVVLENTPKGPEISLKQGGISLKGQAKLIASGEEIQVDGTLSASADTKSGSLELKAEKGKLTLLSEGNQTELISEGNSLLIDRNGETTVKAYSIRRVLPEVGSEFILDENDPKKSFEAAFIGEGKDLQHIEIQISKTEAFKKYQSFKLRKDLKAQVDLSKLNGELYWRVFDSKEKKSLSSIGKFSVINPMLWTWKTPEHYRYAQVTNEGLNTKLVWNELKGADYYQLSISDLESKPFFQVDQIKSNSFVMQRMKNDLFKELILRRRDLIGKDLRLELNAIKQNRKIASLDTSFKFNDLRPPEIPSIKKVEFSKENPENLVLDWEKIDGATGYEVAYHDGVDATSKTNANISVRKLKNSSILKIRSIRHDIKGEWKSIKVDSNQLNRQLASIEPITLTYPLEGSRFVSGEKSSIVTEWEWNSEYSNQVEFFEVELMRKGKSILTKKTKKATYELTNLDPGDYVWHVTAIIKGGLEGQSTKQSFKVVKGAGLEAPVWKE